jgi:quercetin dioxygenase-like cupin family protein
LRNYDADKSFLSNPDTFGISAKSNYSPLLHRKLRSRLNPGAVQKERHMKLIGTILRNGVCAAMVFAALTSMAQAGDCPADKVKDGAVTSGEMMPKGVTDDVLAAIDLTPKGAAFAGELLRMRKLVVQPGGIVPWHDHRTRPANIYIVSGSITEYRSTCQVPIVHNAGETVQEFGESLAHYWKNIGSEPAVLLSADIFNDGKMDNHMM